MVDVSLIQESGKDLFPGLLGVTFLEASDDCVRAELESRPEICTVPGLIHGGALMGFADTLGAVGTFLNLPKGAITTTLESKTNFLRGAKLGERILGECTPIHKGKTTMVWQTRITNEQGKLCALVTQTQMVIRAPQAPAPS